MSSERRSPFGSSPASRPARRRRRWASRKERSGVSSSGPSPRSAGSWEWRPNGSHRGSGQRTNRTDHDDEHTAHRRPARATPRGVRGFPAVADARSAGQPDSHSERLVAALARHQLVLATLLEYAPEPARDALERAIERSGQAIERIGAGQSNCGGNGGGANGGNPGGKPVARPTPRVP